jgi:hypothetical protein
MAQCAEPIIGRRFAPTRWLIAPYASLHREKNMVDDAAYGLSPEALEYARQHYEKTDELARIIAHDVGISRDKLYKIARAERWQLRKDRPPRGLSEALKLEIEATDAENKVAASKAEDPSANADIPPVIDSIAARLEGAVEEQLCEVESLRGQSAARGKRSAEAERISRTLATLTETLFKLRRLRQPGNISGSNDDLPADPDGFRLALARRIDVFVRSRIDGGVSEPGQPGDGEPAAS